MTPAINDEIKKSSPPKILIKQDSLQKYNEDKEMMKINKTAPEKLTGHTNKLAKLDSEAPKISIPVV